MPRLRALDKYQQETGLSLSQVFAPSREGVEARVLPSDVHSLALGMRYLLESDLTRQNIFAGDPAKFQGFLNETLVPLIDFANPKYGSYPKQMSYNLTGGAPVIPFLADHYKPEWQGLINAGTNQITAGKLAAAGME